MEGKKLQVIKSLPLSFVIACLVVFFFKLLSQFSFTLCVFSFMFLFWLFSNLLYFFFKKKKKMKNNKNTKTVCVVYFGTCVSWMAFEIKFLNFVSFVA